ncbi:hypothetical protein J2W46_006272 [Paraburkholderia strydomiana]|nr:hypothetical protein [Paraburkholderia strydomiana]
MYSSIPRFYGMLASTFSGGTQTSAERTIWSTFVGPGNKGFVKDDYATSCLYGYPLAPL